MSASPRPADPHPADPPSDRQRGMGRHWSQVRESTCVWGIWTLYALYRLCGRTLFRAVLYPVVTYYWLARPMARRASLDYLRRVQAATGAVTPAGVIPGLRHSLRHLFSFADTLLDKLLSIGGSYPYGTARREGEEVLLARIASGKGGIIVTAHMGCLELCRVLANQREGMRLTVLVHTAHAAQFNRILQRLNPDSGVQLFQVDSISPASAMQLAEKVRAGEFIAIAGDRVPVHGGRAVTAPFLGTPARFPVGPYVLAALLECPLYAMGCVRSGAGHLLRFTELAHEVRLPRARREAALTELAAQYARWLSGVLAESPYDWFNFYDFWAQGGGAGATTRAASESAPKAASPSSLQPARQPTRQPTRQPARQPAPQAAAQAVAPAAPPPARPD